MSKAAANEAAIAAAEKQATHGVKVFDADDLFDTNEGDPTATAVAEPEEENETPPDPDDEENETDLDDDDSDTNDEEDGDEETSEATQKNQPEAVSEPVAAPVIATPATPETEHGLLKRIGDCARECKQAESYVAECKAELKEAKGYYEKLAARLSNLCLALENDRDRPLLAKMEASPPAPVDGGQPVVGEAATDAPVGDASTTTPAEDNSWKEFPVAELDLPDGIVKSLHEADISDMGELAEYTATKQLTDLAGIGPGKAAKIEEATMKFWAERNQVSNAARG